jgi:hypothetical protein
MRRFVVLALACVAILGVLGVFPAAGLAASGKTDVSGYVFFKGSPVKGAVVTVTANGFVKGDVTDKSGAYFVQFSAKSVPAGSTVTVQAFKGKKSGSNTGTAGALTTKLNVALVNVDMVPEFGMIAGGAALLIGGGAFLFMRRRRLAV